MAFYVPDHIQKQRMAICRACPSLIQGTILGIPLPGDRPQCAFCLCFMKEKTKWTNKACDIGKWKKYKPA